jgi:hypothetical protein
LEAWIFIWVIHNLSPDMHYKKVFVILGVIVPGPNKASEIDSFYSHCFTTSLQCESLKVYDSSLNMVNPNASPMVIFSTVDIPSSALMSEMIGHTGKMGADFIATCLLDIMTKTPIIIQP